MKYRLVGARKFLKIAKPGTLFIPLEYWGYDFERSSQKLKSTVEEFKENPQYVYDINWSNLHIFVDNGGSITFYYDTIDCNEEDNYIFYYDYNVVGDADPENTLYLIVNSIEDLPDYIDFECYNDKISEPEFDEDFVVYNNKEKRYTHYLRLSKEEIKKRYENILNEECKEASENNNDWAREKLNEIENDKLDLGIGIEK